MFAKTRTINRKYVGKDIQNIMDVPDLIEIQTSSYESFLQAEKLKRGEPLANQGLQEVFTSTFPIESPNGDMTLEYEYYELDYANIKFSELQCKQKGTTYAVPLKARIDLTFNDGHIIQKDIYLGDIPIMTERGTFVINGAERVVVSQIHRSPGVIFQHEKGVYSSRIIPYRGSWLEFVIDQKKELIFAKIDRKSKILGTIFLRALGYETREEIIRCFYKTEDVKVLSDTESRDALVNKVLASKVVIKDENGEEKRLFNAGTRLHPHDVDDLIANNIGEICVIKFNTKVHPNSKEEKNESLDSDIIINCFEREELKYVKEGSKDSEVSKEDALAIVYDVLMPGEPITVENAEKDLTTMFFSERRYDLGRVGRHKLNKKFGYEEEKVNDSTLIKDDIVNTMKILIKVYGNEETVDDIDHLGNRRVRCVGELLTNSFKTAFSRMERIVKERMGLKETETMKPQDLISIKPIVSAVKEFFGSSQLSQFMDQVNPLAELTHKRRLTALGPGGLSRDRAGFEVRDVHYSHYGRMCPIETPEGPNIGLIVSLAMFTKISDYGFLMAPYRKVVNGKATKQIDYLDAMDEDKYSVGQLVEGIKEDGTFPTDMIPCRDKGDYAPKNVNDIDYIDVSPRQVISVSASLIPFLEHDDANRALMGCNMQRQGVPLLFPEPPHVGTGMERKAAYDSGVLVKAKYEGDVIYVASDLIKVKPTDPAAGEINEYPLLKYQKTNSDTCNHQRPIVEVGQHVKKGDVLADGPATFNGELALGRNLLVGFVPWNGYNYEDAVLISQRVVREDMYTTVHIKEFEVDIRETKLGAERITRDIPNTSVEMLDNLDANGIVRIGAKVGSNDYLVGKVAPKGETETTPEFKLLNSIFGEKAKDVRDVSLRVPHGVEGVVIDVQHMKRTEGDDQLSPGVEEVVKVIIANKRKLREGDKMAGRHGNKGVVARILPPEDMPYLEDGTPLDVCLNPLGVPSRMNIGQIMESELGIAGKYLNEFYESPVFQSPSQEMIAEKLKEAGLSSDAKQIVRDGRTGEPFINPIFVGVIYFMKLHHLVDDKMHARSIGPYSLVTQQPLGGKAQFGGQRLGEMEVWALEAYGAANCLQEMMTIKSDDMNGRSKIYNSIVKGDPSSPIGVPESFNVLVQELRGLALDFTIYDDKGKQIALTERDQDLIDKAASGFDKENVNA